MKPGRFSYHCPSTLDEAIDLLAEHGEEAKVLAGGQSLVPMLNLRLSSPSVVIDLNRLPLTDVAATNGALRIGAMVRHQHFEHDPQVRRSTPLLAAAAPLIGHPAIRVRGTIGGSVAHADPAAEWPTTLLALDGVVRVRSRRGERLLPAAELFEGPFMTGIAEDELLTEVVVPVHGDAACAYEELAISAGDFALVGVAVALQRNGNQRVTSARIAISGAASVPIRASAAEDALLGEVFDSHAARRAGELAAAATNPGTDIHASAEYRRHLAAVLTERALAAAVGRLQ